MTYHNSKVLMLGSLVLLCSACSSKPGPDYHDVVRDARGQVVRTDDGDCVRTKRMTDRDWCSPQYAVNTKCPTQSMVVQRALTQKQKPRQIVNLSQEERTVYFNFDRSVLSPGSKERLNTLASVLKANQSVKEARVVGFADRIGSTEYNEKLSQRRAEVVRDYLIANGYTNARVTETRWVGESESSTDCPVKEARDQMIKCLHDDRKVEVEIEYLSE